MTSSEAYLPTLPDAATAADLPVHSGASAPFIRHRVPVAIAGSVVAAAAFAVYPVSLNAVIAAAFAAVLVVVSATDLERRIIPNRIILPAIALVLVARIAVSPSRTPEYIVAMLGLALFLLLPNFVNASAIGMGDVKLAALLGAGLGWDGARAVALGFILLAPVALVTLGRGGKAACKTALPLGPFLALGGVIFLIVPQLLVGAGS
jgi:leader peptidase (prepilin peptidase)/N-methyltransferase